MNVPAARRPGFLDGVRAFRQGLKLLREPGIRPWAIGPVMLAAVLFGLAATFGIDAINQSLDQVLDTQWEPLRWILWPLLALAFGLVLAFGMVVIAGVLATPLLGPLANAVERHLGQDPKAPVMTSTEGGWWREVTAGLRKLRYFALLSLVLLLGLLIPLINIAGAFWWFAGGAWLLAIEFMDGAFAHHGRLFPSALLALRQHRRLGFGFGAAVALWSLIPVLNCLALPAALAGAHLLYRAHFSDSGA